MKLYRHILYVLIVLLCSSYTVPTPDKDSIEELKKTADKHFEKGEYDQALVPYQKLLGLEQSNYEYRYKYGACLLFATGDKQKALEFLEQSKGRNGVTSDIYYYLGKAYHLNYRFAEAIDAYKKYEQFAPQKDKDRFQIKRQIEMAQNGRNLLKNVTDIAVITKNRVNNSKFTNSTALITSVVQLSTQRM